MIPGAGPARRAAAAVVVTALAAGHVLAAPPGSPQIPRAELDGLQASVEAAVTRVSRPAGLMFGRPSRAYHVKGYGTFIVLAPRALPRVRRPPAAGPEARAMAEFVRRMPPRPRPDMPPRDIQALLEEAEAFRRQAERAMENAERDVLIRLGVPDPPDTPEPAVLATPPAPPAPMTAPVPPAPGVPPVPTITPADLPPPAPGWPFWFGEEEAAGTPPDLILSEVRRAIVVGLGAYRGGLGLLGPNEFVVVAVDFVPRIADRARSRTVVVRARKGDLAAHRAGRLTTEALRARVEFDEY